MIPRSTHGGSLTFLGRHREDLLAALDAQCARARALREDRNAAAFDYAVRQALEHGNDGPLLALAALRDGVLPVTIDEFLESPDFLGRLTDIWPALRADLGHLNPDVFIGEDPVHEVFLGGATGIGKSSIARISTLYQIYLLTRFRSPQELFRLEPQTTLVFPLQSTTPDVTQRVLYEPFRRMFEDMPYTQKHLDWNRRRTASLEIAGGIHVVPLIAGASHLLGQAIPGAVLDEVNFMPVVERSKRVSGPRGLGGRYDQAEELYRELTQRRKSRFMAAPISIGTLIFCSSTRYHGDFLDRRIKEDEESSRSCVYWTRRSRYSVLPSDRYSGKTFPLLVGDERRRTRPLCDANGNENVGGREDLPDDALIIDVPIEHLPEFRHNPEEALRTIAGIAVSALNPFIDRPETIEAAIERGLQLDLQPWTAANKIVLQRDGWPEWLPDNLSSDREEPRFVHIDLSTSRDACGIAVVKPRGFRSERRDDDLIERQPLFVVEAAFAIQPSPENEIVIGELRRFIAQLIDRYRLNIVQITSDGYRAADFRQLFRSLRVRVEEISVDNDPAPYEHLRDCLYEGRLVLVESDILEDELIQLERNLETGRVDHPPLGSKDVTDAVAGALFAAKSSNYIRSNSGYFDCDGYRPEGPRPNPPRPRSTRRRHARG